MNLSRNPLGNCLPTRYIIYISICSCYYYHWGGTSVGEQLVTEGNTRPIVSSSTLTYFTWVHSRFLVDLVYTRSLVLCVCFVDRCLSFVNLLPRTFKLTKSNVYVFITMLCLCLFYFVLSVCDGLLGTLLP